MRAIFILILSISIVSCTSVDTDNLVSMDIVDSLQNRIAELEAEPGFVHNVYFWLKEGTSEDLIRAWTSEMAGFKDIPSVSSFYHGPPAMTEREVVDNSYDYSISVHFTDKAAHDAYQEDPIHLKMIDNHKDIWERVQVYDNFAGSR